MTAVEQTLTITLPAPTLRVLRGMGCALYAFHGTVAAGPALPVVWANIGVELETLSLTWTESPSIYVSADAATAGTTIHAGDVVQVVPGDAVIIGRGGDFDKRCGPTGRIEVRGAADAPRTWGFAYPVHGDAKPSPVSAITLIHGSNLVLPPPPRIVLVFASVGLRAGLVVTDFPSIQADSENLLDPGSSENLLDPGSTISLVQMNPCCIDAATTTAIGVSFDAMSGQWTGSGSAAVRTLTLDDPLVPLLTTNAA